MDTNKKPLDTNDLNETGRAKDPGLDVPAEANTSKHINFLAEEEKAKSNLMGIDLETEEDERRREEFRKGIEEGKRERGQQ